MNKCGKRAMALLALAFVAFGVTHVQAADNEAIRLVPNMSMTSLMAQRTFRNTLPSIVNYSQTAFATSASAKAGSSDAMASMTSSYCSPNSNWVMWDTPFLVSETRKADGDLLGYDTTMTGFSTGISRILGENSAIGLAVGYDSYKLSNTDRNIWSGRADTFHAALYGGTAIGCFFMDAYAGYSYDWQRFDIWAPGTTDTGKFNDTILSAGVKASYVWILPNEMRITPSLGLDYSHVRMNSFTSHTTNTAVDSNNYNQLRMPISVSVNRTFSANFLSFRGQQSLWTPEFRATWTPQFGAKHITRVVGGAGSIDSAPRADSYGTVGAGLKIKLAGKYIFGVDYDYTFASGYRNHTLTGTYGVSF